MPECPKGEYVVKKEVFGGGPKRGIGGIYADEYLCCQRICTG